MLLEIQNLTFGWSKDALFEKINCSLNQGEIVQLSGENGSGKTTLLNLIAGLIPHFNRGQTLSGDIMINERSIIALSPKHFFPTIALVPSINLELFLLTETLDEEILLARSFLKIDNETFKNRLEEFARFFPEIVDMINAPLENMQLNQKILALTFVFFLQNARLFLFDEVLASFSQIQIEKWYSYFNWLISNGCGIIFVDHQHHRAGISQWLLNDKKLIRL